LYNIHSIILLQHLHIHCTTMSSTP